MSQQTRPRLASHALDLPNHCDICNRARSSGNHQACSKARQTRQSAYWDAYMTNVEAKRMQKANRNSGHKTDTRRTVTASGAQA
ncbi:hypothetical protein [Pseudomonas sp. HLS-6]|uniref:hypothetical protein n=1 Tax=Pseudomonas sp. HLS-6 TaxID=2049589 RepID=UPI0021156CCE|nr:hypothetical protein [Pseudomonas sp. HLS-6]